MNALQSPIRPAVAEEAAVIVATSAIAPMYARLPAKGRKEIPEVAVVGPRTTIRPTNVAAAPKRRDKMWKATETALPLQLKIRRHPAVVCQDKTSRFQMT